MIMITVLIDHYEDEKVILRPERFFTNSLYFFLLQCSFLLLGSRTADGFILRLITETLQNNVAGEPITHVRTDWDFDPEAARKARTLYYEVNEISDICII